MILNHANHHLAEITISFTAMSFTVQEGESTVTLNLAVFGFPEDPFSFRVPVEAFILLYSGDNSAQGWPSSADMESDDNYECQMLF